MAEERREAPGSDPARDRPAAMPLSDAVYRTALTSLPDFAVVIVDRDGAILSWNEGARQLLGWSEAEVLGKPLSIVFTPEDVAEGRPWTELRAAARDGHASDERWHVRKDGTRFWGSGTVVPIRPDGDIIGFVKILQDLSRSHEAEEALRESEARFRRMADTAPVMIWTAGPDRRFTFVNAAWLEFTGATPEEAFGSGWVDRIHPEERGRYLERYAKAFDERQPFRVEYRLRRHDGEYRWVLDSGVPRFNPGGRFEGFIGSALDVHERVVQRQQLQANTRRLEELTDRMEQTMASLRERTREAEEARARSESAERRARLLSEASRVLASSLEPEETLRSVVRIAVPELADGCVVYVLNNGELVQAGYAHAVPGGDEIIEELERDYPMDLSDPQSPIARVLRTREPIVVSEVDDQVLSRIAKDERHREILTSAGLRSFMLLPMVARGTVLGAMAFAVVGDRPGYGPAELALAEDLVRRAAMAVDNARLYRAAVVANRAKSEFLAVMSHELRTPLTAIIGFAELLELGVPERIPEAALDQVNRIKRAADHLLSLIDELLTFSRLEAGTEDLQLETVDLGSLAREAGAVIGPRARDKGLEFEIDAPRRATPVRTDARKLRQIMLNLLSNAVKFTEKGEVVLRVRAVDGAIEISVRDTGIGIPAEELDRIFDPFWQLEKGATRRAGGTGLGLSLTRRLARMLGGDVSVESTPGRGSTFTVKLPEQPMGTGEPIG